MAAQGRRRYRVAVLPTSSTITWPGMRTEYAVLPPHQGATTTGTNQLGIAFSGHRRMVREVDGDALRCDAAPGAVYVTGSRPITWLEVRNPTEALEIYPDLNLAGGLAGSPIEVRSALDVRDGILFAVATALRRQHMFEVTWTDIEASSIAHRVVRHLVSVYGGAAPDGGEHRLPARTVDLVAQYVDAHVGGPITLEAMAAVVPFSPFHFARSFKAATGLTPHGYVTAHRLMVAKDRLLRSDDSVAEVAAAVGFKNVSHFRRLLRRHFDATPAQLRAAT
jgi:AraC family transcriptional regulator